MLKQVLNVHVHVAHLIFILMLIELVCQAVLMEHFYSVIWSHAKLVLHNA